VGAEVAPHDKIEEEYDEATTSSEFDGDRQLIVA
jgi:hypothetical protein